ncbi:MAG: DNA-processing protein DprA [Candidatus Omnitrophota bacterium]|nr:DNA-processing protein DprA [Candidatus Omnitrophota bacterium]
MNRTCNKAENNVDHEKRTVINKTCRDIIALTFVPGLGPKRIILLLEEIPETEDIFRCSRSRLMEIAGMRSEQAGKIRSIRDSKEYGEELAYLEKEGIGAVSYKDESYPEELRNIYDPPPVLYFSGDLYPRDADAVAVIGARKCSLYGLQMAEKLGYELAERGVTVVSGMARGIDSAAHRGALKAGGRTIAVMGSGFCHIYPAESGKLMRSISEKGAVLTEYPSGTLPLRSNFPRRNRIISGMSRGVVVVEAARKSGAMITVDLALEQGKEVFAVPGRADFLVSGGTNTLIQNGAKLVMGVDDILEELDLQNKARKRLPGDANAGERAPEQEDLASRELSPGEKKIFGVLKEERSTHVDRLYDRAGLDRSELSESLLRLEIAGLISALPGGNYVIRRKEAHVT